MSFLNEASILFRISFLSFVHEWVFSAHGMFAYRSAASAAVSSHYLFEVIDLLLLIKIVVFTRRWQCFFKYRDKWRFIVGIFRFSGFFAELPLPGRDFSYDRVGCHLVSLNGLVKKLRTWCARWNTSQLAPVTFQPHEILMAGSYAPICIAGKSKNVFSCVTIVPTILFPLAYFSFN